MIFAWAWRKGYLVQSKPAARGWISPPPAERLVRGRHVEGTRNAGSGGQAERTDIPPPLLTFCNEVSTLLLIGIDVLNYLHEISHQTTVSAVT